MKSGFLKYTIGPATISLLVAASSAHAGLIDTFSVSGNTSVSSAFFGDTYLNIDVVAFERFNGDIFSENVAIIEDANLDNNGGLGVDIRGGGGSQTDTNWGQIDNRNSDEWLSFTSTNGTIKGLYFSLFNTSEQLRIIGSNTVNFFDDSSWIDLVADGGVAGVNGLPGKYDYFALNDTSYKYVSVFLGVGGNFAENGINDALRVRGVEVVPEPSILAIFALGIMGLVSRRFKKKS